MDFNVRIDPTATSSTEGTFGFGLHSARLVSLYLRRQDAEKKKGDEGGDGGKKESKKGDGPEGGKKGGDGTAKTAPTVIDILAKSMALDEIAAGIKRLQDKLKQSEADPNMDDDTKATGRELTDKAVKKLKKAASDLIDDIDAECKVSTDDRVKKAGKVIVEKAKKDFGIEDEKKDDKRDDKGGKSKEF